MTKTDQFQKNVKLSSEVADYLVDNPEYLEKYGNSSVVVFTKDDKSLNKLNRTLVSHLKKEGKKIVKATKTQKKSEPWHFEFVY